MKIAMLDLSLTQGKLLSGMRIIGISIFILGFSFLGQNSGAQVGTEFHGRIGLLRDDFMGAVGVAGDQTSFQGLFSRLEFAQGGSGFLLVGDVASLLSIDSEYFNFFNPRQFYLQFETKSRQNTFKFGRSMEGWHSLDTDWRLGVLEPIFSFDPINRSRQGLTGFFYNFQADNIKLKVFASPFFVPNQGASLRVDGGAIVSASPWFQVPPSTVQFLDRPTPINYSLEMPDVSSIVFQPSLMAKAEQQITDRLSVSVGAGSKPANALALNYRAEGDLSALAGEFRISPRVVRQNLLFIDLEWQQDDFHFGVGYLSETHQRPIASADYTQQIFGNSQFLNSFIRFHQRYGIVSLSYFERVGGQSFEIGPLASQSGSQGFLSDPYALRQAVAVKLQSRPLGVSQIYSALAGIEYTHELASGGSHLRAAIDIKMPNGLGAMVGFDLLAAGVLRGTQQDLFSKYALNDRFFAGFDYVF